MTVLRYILVLNLAFTACNGLEKENLISGFFGYAPITEPFEFEKWSELVNISIYSSKTLWKNPISYSKKLATKMTLNLAPLTITKVDLDKNVW